MTRVQQIPSLAPSVGDREGVKEQTQGVLRSISWACQLGGRKKCHNKMRDSGMLPPCHHAAVLLLLAGSGVKFLCGLIQLGKYCQIAWNSQGDLDQSTDFQYFYYLYLWVDGFFPPLLIRLWLPMYFCDKSLTLIILSFRNKQGDSSKRRFFYIMHVDIHIPFSSNGLLQVCERPRTLRGRCQYRECVFTAKPVVKAELPCPEGWIIRCSFHPIAHNMCMEDAPLQSHLSSSSINSVRVIALPFYNVRNPPEKLSAMHMSVF